MLKSFLDWLKKKSLISPPIFFAYPSSLFLNVQKSFSHTQITEYKSRFCFRFDICRIVVSICFVFSTFLQSLVELCAPFSNPYFCLGAHTPWIFFLLLIDGIIFNHSRVFKMRVKLSFVSLGFSLKEFFPGFSAKRLDIALSASFFIIIRVLKQVTQQVDYVIFC